VVNFPQLNVGDVYNVESVVTNQGLVRADNLSYTLPSDTAYLHFELISTIPSSLDAGASIVIIYRAHCLQSFPGSSSGSTTAGLFSHNPNSAIAINDTTGLTEHMIGQTVPTSSSMGGGATLSWGYTCASGLYGTGSTVQLWIYAFIQDIVQNISNDISQLIQDILQDLGGNDSGVGGGGGILPFISPFPGQNCATAGPTPTPTPGGGGGGPGNGGATPPPTPTPTPTPNPLAVQITTPNDTPIFPDQAATINCQASGGDGNYTYTWTFNGTTEQTSVPSLTTTFNSSLLGQVAPVVVVVTDQSGDSPSPPASIELPMYVITATTVGSETATKPSLINAVENTNIDYIYYIPGIPLGSPGGPSSPGPTIFGTPGGVNQTIQLTITPAIGSISWSVHRGTTSAEGISDPATPYSTTFITTAASNDIADTATVYAVSGSTLVGTANITIRTPATVTLLLAPGKTAFSDVYNSVGNFAYWSLESIWEIDDQFEQPIPFIYVNEQFGTITHLNPSETWSSLFTPLQGKSNDKGHFSDLHTSPFFVIGLPPIGSTPAIGPLASAYVVGLSYPPGAVELSDPGASTPVLSCQQTYHFGTESLGAGAGVKAAFTGFQDNLGYLTFY
jgi:hypothetical protein